jgi:hypothetical protein
MFATAADPFHVSPPIPVLVVLLLTVGAASAMFIVLVWRATSHRRWVALAEWARERGFRFDPRPMRAPAPPLDAIRGVKPRARICLTDRRTLLAEIQTEGPAAAPAPESTPTPREATTPTGDPPLSPPPPPTTHNWHVLIRPIEADWLPTGARPAQARASLLDLFSLASFPLLGNSERFVIYGADSAAARALAGSSARALLPPDIGLLLHGRHLLLDFSARPFDAIEFDRMIALADQIVAHLPPPG